jgi:hypothetical protein
MKTLKSPADCLKQYLPPLLGDKRTLRARVRVLKRRVKALQIGHKQAHQLVIAFEKAIQREQEKAHVAETRQKPLEQAVDAQPQIGMHVSPVYGNKKSSFEKTSKKDKAQDAEKEKV